MARNKYRLTTKLKNQAFRESPMDEAIIPAMSAESMRDFWAEVRRQGEELRAKQAIIPRNHVWADDLPEKRKSGRK